MISGEGQPLNKAQGFVFFKKGEKWLWTLCERALRKYDHPDSTYWAGDLSQDVLISLGKLSDEYWDNEVKSEESYVRGIVKNAAIQMCIRQKNRHEVSSDSDLDSSTRTSNDTPGFSPDEALILADLVEKILRTLNDQERVIFDHLIENGGSKNLKELALKLGISDGAARQRVVRLRDKIEQLLIEANENSPPEPDSDAISLAILADGYD